MCVCVLGACAALGKSAHACCWLATFHGKKQKCRVRSWSCAPPATYESITKLTFCKSETVQPVQLHAAGLVIWSTLENCLACPC